MSSLCLFPRNGRRSSPFLHLELLGTGRTYLFAHPGSWRWSPLSSSPGPVALCRPFLLSTNSVNGGVSLGNSSGILQNPQQPPRTSAELGDLLRFAWAPGRGLDRPAVLRERRAGRWIGGKGEKCHRASGTRQDRSAFASVSHPLISAFAVLSKPAPPPDSNASLGWL